MKKQKTRKELWKEIKAILGNADAKKHLQISRLLFRLPDQIRCEAYYHKHFRKGPPPAPALSLDERRAKAKKYHGSRFVHLAHSLAKTQNLDLARNDTLGLRISWFASVIWREAEKIHKRSGGKRSDLPWRVWRYHKEAATIAHLLAELPPTKKH